MSAGPFWSRMDANLYFCDSHFRLSNPWEFVSMTVFLIRTKRSVLAGILLVLAFGVSSTAIGQATTPTPQEPLSQQDFEKAIVELYESKKLASPASYETIRDLHARRFEQTHQSEIKTAFGSQAETINAWFAEHPGIKNELYTAIDPAVDDVTNALKIFKTLFETYPEKIVPYSELAIATSVVWDKKKGVYDYAGHQKRAKASMPSDQVDGIEGFQFLVDAEPFMEGRIKLVPWEFLKHVVNQYTPLNERSWAAENHLRNRVGFGKCYKDVPYDHLMLKTQSKEGKLNNHEYTLANLKQYGGVCAHQADYASRVGKSIGVPAEFVSGEATSGSRHAWVMWVELKSATKQGIKFSLESYGRYNIDQYYVGHLRDPQSGKRITDRELELRLHTVGMDAHAKRQSDLIMESFPLLVANAKLDIADQEKLISDITKLCPGNEAAWTKLAELSTPFVELRKSNRKKMLKKITSMFRTFENFPDFTWEIFDSMIQFETDVKKRNKLYGQLLAYYVNNERPDLACKARLKLTDYLVADGNQPEAVEGLAATIVAFPGEGRYVPKMLDRIDKICQTDESLDSQRVEFYAKYLPMVPKYRIATPSKFCVKTFERAIKLFEQSGSQELVASAKQELADIRSGAALERDKKKR